ncbi:TPA: hypothetical protein U1B53_002097 [Streptococcus suis]|nr:hypothetical protein [Streptococcus suis]
MSDEVENREFYYNPFNQKIIQINSETLSYNLFDSTKNQFQYRIDGSENLYVDGNSLNNEFRLIRMNLDSIEVLYRFSKNEGVFPIGVKKGKLYFIHCFYKENGEEEYENRRLSIFDLNSHLIEDFREINGLIDYGTLTNDYIYYSKYIESDDIYHLMKINYADLNGMPEYVRSLDEDGLIIGNSTEYYFVEENNLISNKNRFKKESINYFQDDSLVQFYINQDNHLCLRITETETNSITEFEDILGIRILNERIQIRKKDEVLEYEL